MSKIGLDFISNEHLIVDVVNHGNIPLILAL